jgi:hypothetical protein
MQKRNCERKQTGNYECLVMGINHLLGDLKKPGTEAPKVNM